MTTGSGLDAQVGFGQESTWGTAVTPDRFLEFDSEDMKQEPTFLEPAGLRAGKKFKRENRVVISRNTVNGSVTLEHATKGMGLIWKNCLASSGSAVKVSGGTAAYDQYHTYGDFLDLGLTVQIGRPEPSTGTVRPFTYSGCKVGSWEFTLTDGDIPTLQVNFDGRKEDTSTALASASYTTGSSVFNFSQATLKLGGSASTSSGKTTITGGTAVATVVTEVTISGESPMAVERFGIGNAGFKSEQLENDIPTVTGTLNAEFNKTELYDVFTGNDTFPMQLTLEGDAIEGSTNYKLDFILPAVKLKTAAPNVGGPDIVQMSTDFEAYDNESDPVIQVHLVSTDTSV